MGKELKPQTWGLIGNSAPGFQFLPGFNKEMFSLSFWQSFPTLPPTLPAIHKHIYFFSGLYMISKLDIASDGVGSPKLHLETKAAGHERWNGQSHRAINECLSWNWNPDSQIFPSYQEGPLAQFWREPTDVDPKCSRIEKGMTWVTGMCRLRLQQAGISRANFTYYLSVQD